LGSDDPDVIADWKESSKVDLTILPADPWEGAVQWLGFYGFIVLFTANFTVRTINDDKRKGMPDRLGVLPQQPRTIIINSTFAVFTATTMTTILLLIVLQLMVGEITNVVPLFFLLSLYNLFSVGLVLALFSVLKNSSSASIAITMFATLSSMLGGLFWPIEITPEIMQRIARLTPGYWFVQGLHNVRDVTFNGYGIPILFLAGFSLVALLLCGWKKIQPLEE
jgi:ABC-2 type transport system permease protein